MLKKYYIGEYFLEIGNEKPMTDDGHVYALFDLKKYEKCLTGCPINQFGPINKIIDVLNSYIKVDIENKNSSVFETVKDLLNDEIKTYEKMIEILEEYK